MTKKQLQLITVVLLGLICLLGFEIFRQQQKSNQNNNSSTELQMLQGLNASDGELDKSGIVSEGELSDYLNSGTDTTDLGALLIDPELFNILQDIDELVPPATASK